MPSILNPFPQRRLLVLLLSLPLAAWTPPAGAASRVEVDQTCEQAGPNLAKGGDFEGGSLRDRWQVDTAGGTFGVDQAQGRTSKTAARMRMSSTRGRGKLFLPLTVPAGADLRVSVWARCKDFPGGVWVNLEGPGAPKSKLFYLAGGTCDWTRYACRFTSSTAKAAAGQPVKLSVWFYVYGKGSITIDDLQGRVIKPDAGALARRAATLAQRVATLEWGSATAAVKQAAANVKASGNGAFGRWDEFVKTCAGATSGSGDWGVFAVSSLQRVFRKKRLLCPMAPGVDLDLARGEIEGAQVVVLAGKADLPEVRVRVTGLEGLAGADRAAVQVLPVAYGKRNQQQPLPWYEGGDAPEWPDPLLPNRAFTVTGGTMQPVYLRLRAARRARPGTYRGRVKITTAAGQASLPLIVRVHRVTLPVRFHLRTMLVGGRKQKPYLDLALEQHMGLGTIYAGMTWSKFLLPEKGGSFDFSRVERDLGYAIARGLNAFTIAQTPKSGKWGFPKNYSPAWKRKMSRVIREYGKWLRSKGWSDYAYFNNIDEPWSNRWHQVKEIYAMAKAADPKVRVFSCVNKVGALDALKEHADAFDVYVQQYGLQQGLARQREGKEIWWAVCIWPSERPNFFIEYPLLDERIIGWMSYKYRISGFEYWDLTNWNGDWKPAGRKAPADDSWITCPGGVLVTDWQYGRKRRNGDGYLCYPGPDGKPVNSLRFEALRDGLEENQLLHQLQEHLCKLKGQDRQRARALLAGERGPVINPHLYAQDPQVLLAARRELFELLDR